MPRIRARRLLAATLSRYRRAWLCGLLILATSPVPLPATRGQQPKAIVIDDFNPARWPVGRSSAAVRRLVCLYERQDSTVPVR